MRNSGIGRTAFSEIVIGIIEKLTRIIGSTGAAFLNCCGTSELRPVIDL